MQLPIKTPGIYIKKLVLKEPFYKTIFQRSIVFINDKMKKRFMVMKNNSANNNTISYNAMVSSKSLDSFVEKKTKEEDVETAI